MPVLYQGGAGGGGGAQVGISTIGNTSGDTGLASSQLVLAGSNLTLSGSTNGSSMTITISAPGTAAQFTGGISGGNTSGHSGTVASRIVFVGGDNITLSGSSTGGSMTITVSGAAGGAAPTLNRWFNHDVAGGHSTFATLTNLKFWPLVMQGPFPGNMTVESMYLMFSGSGHTDSTAVKTLTASLGIYTLSGSSTLNMLYQATSTVSIRATSDQSSAVHGPRFFSFVSSQFSNSASAATTPSFSQGHYIAGVLYATAGQALSISHCGLQWLPTGAAFGSVSGTLGTSTAQTATRGWHPLFGTYSSGALPVTLHLQSVTRTDVEAYRVPMLIFENQYAGPF